jgi:hypothetical protein
MKVAILSKLPMPNASDQLIGTILKHDKKTTSYKIALLRAINDVVLSFPDVAETGLESSKYQSIALPLRMLAEFWVAYYWVFTDPQAPIQQGQISMREGMRRNDVSFRPALEELRFEWEKVSGTPSLASDGFFLLSEFKTPRRRLSYPLALQAAHQKAVRSCMDALQQPIRYAGEGRYTVFDVPRRLKELDPGVKAVAGTQPSDLCLVISMELWNSFRSLSLWIEALAVHEWCLFSERVATNPGSKVHRGDIYFLLTARPDNRRPLTWERNRIELLLLEGVTFVCPWTQKPLVTGTDFDIDHLLPLAIYPINELWNLLPADREFNQRTKRDRIPSLERLLKAEPLIAKAYANYEAQPELKLAVHEDASLRFSNLPSDGRFCAQLATSTVRYIEEVANARSVARF